jgi:hypothetical protein
MRTDLDLLNEWYDSFGWFVTKYNLVYLSELDYYITKNLNLYAVYEQVDFTEIKVATDKIKACLPSIGRIFSKPIIHLIEEDDILPVESIRYVSSKAIDHVASHFELWADVDEDGIQPRKLLSRNYIDNYSIYENVVFANTIDLILFYLRQKTKVLEDLMFSLKLREVNILDRSNHLDYYLALGKLHTGYIRNYDMYLAEANALREVLIRDYHKIASRLYKKVYRLNRNKHITSLHKTNILSMDKDYRKIYHLYKFFDGYKSADVQRWMSFDNANYFWFCEILLLFSIEHFGFAEARRMQIDFNYLDLNFSAQCYRLNVKVEGDDEYRVLLLTFDNQRTYTVAIYPLCRYTKKPSLPLDRAVDEVVYLSPIMSDSTLLVGITELDSFRRLQQVLLRGMISSTEQFETCPFCMGKLVKQKGAERYICASCHEIIERLVCPEKDAPYYNTDVQNIEAYQKKGAIVDLEGKLNFRNINRLTSKGFVCPICKKIH